MGTNKRDLAQELVDFLLKEDELKKASSAAKTTEDRERTKPHLVQDLGHTQPIDTAQRSLQKTVAIQENEGEQLFEFNEAPPVSEPAEKPIVKVVEESLKSGPKPSPVASQSVPVPEHKTSPGPNSSVNRFPTQRANLVFNDVSTLVAGTEAVRVAQIRIKTLETEKEHIRTEMEQLITSSETLQRRYNELKAQNEGLERKHREKLEITEDEKAVLKTRLKAKEEELVSVKRENEDLLARFQSDLRKIRVRERELEHRQEMIRAEMVTVVAGKDEVIVELKRSLEKLHFELDNFRAKSADLNAKINEFYDRNHRTVKALRLALSVLEMGDGDDKPKKKEDS